MAAKHLLSLGRTNIAFIGGSRELKQIANRIEGAETAVAEHPGATLTDTPTESFTVLQGRAIGEVVAAKPAEERPSAIFAANDLIALGVLQALNMYNIEVPGEIALIGYDDIGFAATADTPLSSIRQPAALLGYTAMDMLLREAEQGEHFEHEQIVFQPELVVRESTGWPLRE
jgi:LacI family transcriptional regulator